MPGSFELSTRHTAAALRGLRHCDRSAGEPASARGALSRPGVASDTLSPPNRHPGPRTDGLSRGQRRGARGRPCARDDGSGRRRGALRTRWLRSDAHPRSAAVGGFREGAEARRRLQRHHGAPRRGERARNRERPRPERDRSRPLDHARRAPRADPLPRRRRARAVGPRAGRRGRGEGPARRRKPRPRPSDGGRGPIPHLRSQAARSIVLEDVTERPYRIDRMLTSLSLGGYFDEAAAIVFGSFTGVRAGARTG